MLIVENSENTHTRKNKNKHFTSTDVITPNIFPESFASSCSRGCFQRGLVAMMLRMFPEHLSCGSGICYYTFPFKEGSDMIKCVKLAPRSAGC